MERRVVWGLRGAPEIQGDGGESAGNKLLGSLHRLGEYPPGPGE